MTRTRQLILGSLAACAIGGMASSAIAEESASFQNRLAGATVGLPLGALPPPGLYTGLETAYLGMPQAVPTQGNFFLGAHVNVPAIAQAIPLLYVPGWHFLGASYGMAVVQAFYENTICTTGACAGAGFFKAGNNGGTTSFTTANTTISPLILSWNLGSGWFVSSGFTFMPPDGTRSFALGPGGTTPNPDYWTFEIPFAFSYLANNWNITGNFFYDINTASTGSCCGTNVLGGPGVAGTVTSGNLLYGDLHALYKFGKWSVGPVASFEVQTTSDTGSGCTSAVGAAIPLCARFGQAGVGGLVGYDFGPVDLQVWVLDQVACQNCAEGPGAINVFTRLGFKLWGPEAPKPLVAKN